MDGKSALTNLCLDTDVRCLFLFSSEGYLVEETGDTDGLDKDGLLVSIFETGNSLGIVRYYTKKTLNLLEETLSTGILPPLDKFIDEAAFTNEMNDSIDQLLSK